MVWTWRNGGWLGRSILVVWVVLLGAWGVLMAFGATYAAVACYVALMSASWAGQFHKQRVQGRPLINRWEGTAREWLLGSVAAITAVLALAFLFVTGPYGATPMLLVLAFASMAAYELSTRRRRQESPAGILFLVAAIFVALALVTRTMSM